MSTSFLGIPVEFLLFGGTLLGIALFHAHTLRIAVGGMLAVVAWRLAVSGFSGGTGLEGLAHHVAHEWITLANLLGLLVGFALLSRHFELSQVPDVLPKFLPDDWKGGFVLLVIVFVLSSFLDNIAAALIGGAIAQTVFRHKVHVGYVAALVAASNAGGSGSVVGDTTTTMMWLAGVDPLAVLPAFIAASVALVVCGIPASLQQHRHQPILKHERRGSHVEWARVGIVATILVVAVVANVTVNTQLGEAGERFPFLGAAVWLAILVTAPVRRPDWSVVPGALRGAAFLLSLVFAASLMPVEQLPPASWSTAFGLGFVSSVFDNIPLTALALKQGGYDWGTLAFSVGFGGSMIWFGSSAGVAITGLFPQARSVGEWLRAGWHVALGYVAGALVMLAVWGWQPTPMRGQMPDPGVPTVVPAAGAPGAPTVAADATAPSGVKMPAPNSPSAATAADAAPVAADASSSAPAGGSPSAADAPRRPLESR